MKELTFEGLAGGEFSLVRAHQNAGDGDLQSVDATLQGFAFVVDIAAGMRLHAFVEDQIEDGGEGRG